MQGSPSPLASLCPFLCESNSLVNTPCAYGIMVPLLLEVRIYCKGSARMIPSRDWSCSQFLLSCFLSLCSHRVVLKKRNWLHSQFNMESMLCLRMPPALIFLPGMSTLYIYVDTCYYYAYMVYGSLAKFMIWPYNS
ncbi:unnamed protein product [Urochloa humidicola]